MLDLSLAASSKELPSMLIFRGKVKNHDVDILVDSGACGNFISQDLVHRAKILTRPLKNRQKITLADGTLHTITDEAARLFCQIQEYSERLDLEVAPLRGHDIILG